MRRSSGTSTLVEYYGHDEADRLIWTNTGGNTPPSGTITSGPARAQYGYDEFGQVTSRVRRNADGTYITQRLKWDGAGRLAEASDDRRANPIFTATYTASGQRLTKADPVTGAHDYSYGLFDSRGLTKYLPGAGMQSATGKLYALTDRLGSTRATTTAQGVVSERIRYDAWGRITAQTGAVPVGTPLFAGSWGYEREPEGVTGLGLDYLTHRYYDPQIGRFISRDPIGWAGGLNLYGYCEDDPVNGVDPLGLVEHPLALFVIGAGDSLSLGIAPRIRGTILYLAFGDEEDGVDERSGWYRGGEATATAASILATGGAGTLQYFAKKACSRAVRAAAGNEMAKNGVREAAIAAGKTPHHVNPLFGHPIQVGGGRAVLPTGGLPSALHSGRANIRLVRRAAKSQGYLSAEHAALHMRARTADNIARLMFNRATVTLQSVRLVVTAPNGQK